MGASRSTNTMAEALKDIYQQFAVMETYPDADHEFINKLKEQTLAKIQSAMTPNVPQPPSSLLGAAPPPPLMGPPMGGMAPGGMLAGGGPPMPGPGMGTSIPGSGELARLLGG